MKKRASSLRPNQVGGFSTLPDSEKNPKLTMMRDMLYTDDAAIATHTKEELQLLMDHFSIACKEFSLIISLSKTNFVSALFHEALNRQLQGRYC